MKIYASIVLDRVGTYIPDFIGCPLVLLDRVSTYITDFIGCPLVLLDRVSTYIPDFIGCPLVLLELIEDSVRVLENGLDSRPHGQLFLRRLYVYRHRSFTTNNDGNSHTGSSSSVGCTSTDTDHSLPTMMATITRAALPPSAVRLQTQIIHYRQ